MNCFLKDCLTIKLSQTLSLSCYDRKLSCLNMVLQVLMHPCPNSTLTLSRRLTDVIFNAEHLRPGCSLLSTQLFVSNLEKCSTRSTRAIHKCSVNGEQSRVLARVLPTKPAPIMHIYLPLLCSCDFS
jgi:hypothetical protein